MFVHNTSDGEVGSCHVSLTERREIFTVCSVCATHLMQRRERSQRAGGAARAPWCRCRINTVTKSDNPVAPITDVRYRAAERTSFLCVFSSTVLVVHIRNHSFGTPMK